MSFETRWEWHIEGSQAKWMTKQEQYQNMLQSRGQRQPFVALGQFSLKTSPFSSTVTRKGNAAPRDQKEKYSDHLSFYSQERAGCKWQIVSLSSKGYRLDPAGCQRC